MRWFGQVLQLSAYAWEDKKYIGTDDEMWACATVRALGGAGVLLVTEAPGVLLLLVLLGTEASGRIGTDACRYCRLQGHCRLLGR